MGIDPPPANVVPLHRAPKSAPLDGLGSTLFLGSWGISFLGLFVACAWIRLRAGGAWPPAGAPELPLGLPTAGSCVALFSSAAAHGAVVALREARRDRARRGLAAAMLLGVAFLALQGATWGGLWAEGLRLHRRAEGEPWDAAVAYAGCFYASTAFHAAHVAAGVGLLGWAERALAKGRFGPADHAPVRFAVWFQHFVTAAWLGVFALLYLWR